MQLTSKQWIALLVSLFVQQRDNVALPQSEGADPNAPEIPFGKQYADAIQQLIAACLLIVKNRLGLPDDFVDYHSLGMQTRSLAAFREASVKWNAIVHGVRMQLADADPVPVSRAALILSLIDDLQERLVENRVKDHTAKQAIRFYRELITTLNWNDHPAVEEKLVELERLAGRREFELEQERAVADLPEIEGYIRSVGELNIMNRKLAAGHKLHPKQMVKVDALRKWVHLNRKDILAKIERLPGELQGKLIIQVHALLVEIEKPIEQLKAEVLAAPRATQPARKKHRRKKRAHKPAEQQPVAEVLAA